ncbi:MAG: hypothetical protein ABIS39_02030 [Sphingomicrobium sp.]
MTGKSQLVAEVTDVSTSWLESEPPFLVVNAKGKVGTPGWTNPTLTRAVYVTPPADGIQEYDFSATPPTGIVQQVVTAIAAADRWHDPANWVKGVRVKSATNSMEEASEFTAE